MEPAILKLVSSCKKAISLRSLLLSGNPGVTWDVVGKVTEILDALPYEEARHIRAY